MSLVDWYNYRHRQSGIMLMFVTPHQRESGQAVEIRLYRAFDYKMIGSNTRAGGYDPSVVGLNRKWLDQPATTRN